MKKSVLLLMLIMLLGMISYQTIAYYITSSKTVNVVTTKNIELALLNTTTNAKGEEVILTSSLTTVLAGDTYIQKAYVENTGETNFYARIKLDTIILDKNGNELENIVQFNIDLENWILDEEGWYRYNEVIPVNSITSQPLFSEIYFPLEMDESYNGCTITITLQAQCVQAKYNEDEINEVTGWPNSTIGGDESET